MSDKCKKQTYLPPYRIVRFQPRLAKGCSAETPRRWRAGIPEDLNRQSGAKQLCLFLARVTSLVGRYAGCASEEFDQMDSMRKYQFEEEYDGSVVEADVAAFWRGKGRRTDGCRHRSN
jgi:hypothetical protein